MKFYWRIFYSPLSHCARLFKRCATLTLILLTAFIHQYAVAAVPAILNSSEFSYQNTPAPLNKVLEDFAHAFSLRLVIDPKISSEVKNKLRANTAQQFIERLALEYNLQWFIFEDKLYVSSKTDQHSLKIKVSGESIDSLKKALTDIGLLDKRFGWGELPESAEILVSGPTEYVNLIKMFAEQPDTSKNKGGAFETMFFPLRFAEAADIRVEYQNELITIPGVGTILSELLDANKSSPQLQRYNYPAALEAGESKNPFNNRLGASFSALTDRISLAPALPASSDDKPKIVVSTRSNAILIQDNPAKRSEYAQLIEKLDVPLRSVAIDTLVIDVDNRQVLNTGMQEKRLSRRGSVYDEVINGNKSVLNAQEMKKFQDEIQRIVEQGGASLTARPSLITMENFPAVFNFSNQNRPATKDGPLSTASNGAVLQITPRVIASDKQQALQIKVNMYNKGTTPAPEDNHKTGNLSTLVTVDEGDSLIIGGLSVHEKKNTTFNLRESENRQRFIIITPKIIQKDANKEKTSAKKTTSEYGGSFSKKMYKQIFDDITRLSSGTISPATSPAIDDITIEDVCDIHWPLTVLAGNVKSLATQEYTISSSLIKNAGQQSVVFHDTDCDNDENLMIVPYPNAPISPGAYIEVYIARKNEAQK
ncbi:secretin N-terminal domain-containing protein [Kosakonia sacchari]